MLAKMLLLLSVVMLAGTSVMFFVEEKQLGLPPYLTDVVALLLIICAIGWLPLLIIGLILFVWQAGAPSSGKQH